MSLMCRTRFDEPTRDKSRREKTTDGHTSSLLVYTKKKINAEMETQMRQRVFTGVVTQIQDHHGVVDQEVHFSMSVVVGRVPLVGEKVLVKAVQDPQKPVSWTAQRVQTLNGQPFKSPPPLLPSMSTNPKPGILGSKPQPLLKSPKIPPLIPSMQPNPGGMIQMSHHQQMSWNGPFDGWGGGRKRHGDVMGGRRAGRWEEGGGGGGMWGGDGMHKKRKIWRAISEEEVSKKTTSIPAQSSPLFSFFSRNTQACDSLEVQRRYPHLQVPSDLFHLQLSWTESFRLNQPLPLRGPCLFHVGSRQPEPEAPACEATDSLFSVRVMFLSLPCLEDFYSQCCSLSKDGQMQKEALHPTMLFKFLLLESGGDLQLPGGFWSPAVDGSNPGKDASTLVNTAVRCVKNQTALDLSACTQWHKMAELRYLSGEKMETVVFLMPDVWNQVQTEEEWAKKRQEQQDDDSPLPETPSLVFHPQTGLNLSVLSLSSLLEPQTSQTRDGFEVSLMAELFSEMLQRDFGFQLYQSLCSVPQGPSAHPACVKEDKSTAAEDEPKKSDKQQPKKKGATDSKRRKIKEKDEEGEVDEISLKDDSERPSEHQGESKTQSPGGDGQTSSTSDHQLPKDNDRPLGWTAELPRKVLLSCVFFDRQLAGSLREQDLLNMLLSLGLYLSPAQAQNLLRKVTVGGLCMYRNLCSRWTDTEQTHSSVRAEGNKALLPAQACKERTSSRRSTASSNPDMVNYRGNVVNMSNLLQALESSKTSQRDLEKCVANLQSRLEAAEGQKASNQQDQDQQEELKRKLEKAEKLNKTYEKSLRENANQMTSVIEKMQKMVEQTSVLTNTKEA